jgi:hypothetical protein
MMYQKFMGAQERQVATRGNQYFIVTLFQNLKRAAEALLRWAFFTLNLFMLALYICQN